MHLLRGAPGSGPRASAAPAARRRPTHHHRRLRCRAEASPTPTPTPPLASSAEQQPPPPSLTKRMFDAVDARRAERKRQEGGGAGQQAAGGAGGKTTYDALLAADDAWSRLRSAAPSSFAAPSSSSSSSSSSSLSGPAPQFVRRAEPYEPLLRLGKAPPPQQQFDVCVCGGTLGVFLAASLARRGWRVAVLERGPLKGREQEWNLSRAELRALARAGAFESEADTEKCVVSEFNPVRVGFFDSWSSEAGSASSSSSFPPPSKDVWARDVLNLGVSPDALVQAARRALESRGGKVFERAAADALVVHPDAVALRVRSAATAAAGAGGGGAGDANSSAAVLLSARLVIDCMGHASPAARQLRHGTKPDGVCLVVGGCADGFNPEKNMTADVIATAADTQEVGGVATQLFWEAFPAASSGAAGASSSLRTTYMFAYMDSEAWRPSLATMFEAYWRYMPLYQRGLIAASGDKNYTATDDPTSLLSSLQFERLLFGVFPTYRDSPLKPGFDRVLQVGDASGLQSPLSFGGLAALARHLPRLSAGVDDALACAELSKDGLGPLAPYTPNLSAAWMLQRAMTATRAKSGEGGAPAASSSSSSSSSSSPPPKQLLSSAPPNLINRMLGGNFQAMKRLGEKVSRPFLQDVLRPGGLALTLGAQMLSDPLFVPALLLHLGPGPLADFTRHFAAMAVYDFNYRFLGPGVRFLAGEGSCRGEAGVPGNAAYGGCGGWLARTGEPSLGVPRSVGYRLRRLLDAWKYGSGMDYEFD